MTAASAMALDLRKKQDLGYKTHGSSGAEKGHRRLVSVIANNLESIRPTAA
jgi:hypothetical protein